MQTKKPKVYENILETIGQTPLIELTNITKDNNIKCQFFAKVEFMSPSGSIKDRIARQILQDAEQKGEIKIGSLIVESFSGNFGFALALACTQKNYKLLSVVSDKTPKGQINVLKAIGSEVVVAQTSAFPCETNQQKQLAEKIAKERNGYYVNYLANSGNVSAHYLYTAEEIFDQMDEKLDYCFVASETSRTVIDIGKKLHEKNGNVKMIAVDYEE